jgi:hypothetical protein
LTNDELSEEDQLLAYLRFLADNKCPEAQMQMASAYLSGEARGFKVEPNEVEGRVTMT